MVEWSIAESRHLLAQIVDFAAEYSWLYDFHGTQILDCGILESLPPGWRNTLTALDAGQLNEIAECQSRSEYPQSMQKFLQSCSALSIHQLLPDASDDLLLEWKVEGVGQKKRYEVPRLTRLVAEVQRRTLSHVVLDIGSGLGYVDSLLHHELGTRVLGVESESQRVLSARARHVRECGRECPHLQYLVWRLQDDKDTVLRASALVQQLVDPARAKEVCLCLKTSNFTGPDLPASASAVAVVTGEKNTMGDRSSLVEMKVTSERNTMHEKSPLDEMKVTGESLVGLPEVVPESIVSESFSLNSVEESVTLLGLHACADLSPTMIRLFMCCNKISSMILLSCCYHKLKPAKLEDSSQECCSKASEDDLEPEAEMTHLSETSEGYESDVSDECSKLDRSPQTRPKYVSIQKHSSSAQASSHVPSRQRCRRSSDPKCLFKNFPLSRSGSMLMCKRGFSLSVYGLRLACQEPGSRWRRMADAEHRTHENALLFRAVLDSVCAKHGVDLVKKKRKCANKEQLTSFENYISSVLQCYEIKSSANSHDHHSPSNSKHHSSDGEHSSSAEPESNLSGPAGPIGDTPGRLDTSLDSVSLGCSAFDEQKATSSDPSRVSTSETSDARSPTFDTEDVSLSRLVPALRQCYSQNQHLGPLLEAITGLQLAMQGVLESFVLLDRVLYALESKFCSSVQLTKVFDASVSPRCAALVLYK